MITHNYLFAGGRFEKRPYGIFGADTRVCLYGNGIIIVSYSHVT